MKLLFSLIIYGFALHVKTQQTLQQQYPYYANEAVWNPDRIFYADDRQSGTTVLLPKTPINEKNIGRERVADIVRQINSEGNKVTVQPSVQTSTAQEISSRLNVEDQSPPSADGVIPTNTLAIQRAAVNRNDRIKPKIHSSFGLAISNFGINMLKQIDDQPGNLVFSPSSITTLLALLQQGASGATLEQINLALQMSQTTSAESFYEVAEDLKRRSSNNILKTANNVYVAKDFNLSPAFKSTAIRSFGSDVTSENFGRPDIALKNINSWVASQTNNKILHLLPQGSLDATTQLVLVSATFFKGLWAIPFRPASTKPAEFNVSPGVSKSTLFMRTRRYFRTGVDPVSKAQVIVLPFENDLYSLVLLLPTETSNLSQVLSTLTAAQLLSYQDLPPRDTELSIPKFSVKADIDLAPVLRKMGIDKIFGQSELTGLGGSGTYSPQVSSAVHSAVLSIDEEGGSASASTAFAVVALSYDAASVNFKANRPFLGILWDKRAAIPLFITKIVDPTL